MSATSKPKVLHICSDTNIGGAGRYVLTLLAQPLITTHFDVALACPEGALAEAARRAGIPVLLSGGADVSFSWGALRSFLGIVRGYRPAIVHTHGSLAGRLAGVLGGAKVIYTKHGLMAAEEQAVQVRSAGRLVKRLAVRLFAHRLVAVSEAVKQMLIGLGAEPERIRVIPGGTDLAPYDPSAPLVPGVVGTVGRLSREKGFDVLLEAMAQLKGEARLLVCGDGPLRPELVDKATGLGLGGGSVEFRGFVTDVPGFLRETGLFVSSSRSEGLGLVIVEAMAAGRPVVATRVGAVPEVVADGETGLLVPPEDPVALAGAIRRVLGDPALAARLGQAGRRRAEALFSAERMAQQTAALYEELIGA